MKRCYKCGENTNESDLDYNDKCNKCKRKESDEENNNLIMNIARGDMLNTGIMGGIDLDITTSW